MRGLFFKRTFAVATCAIIMFLFGSCDNAKMRKVYSDPANFVTVTGEVVGMSFSDEYKTVYLKIGNLPSGFSDDYFKIVGKNFEIVRSKSIRAKVHEGDEIEFITSSWYLGDGYIMPIVGLTTADGEELLSFEEGQKNLLNWIG